MTFNPIAYLMNRIKEPSTWAGISLAIAGGQGFAHPWDYVAIACGTIAVLCPQPKKAAE